MAENQVNTPVGYGYADDTVRQNNLKFGLNTNTFLTKFEYIPNGGKDGAQQDALDIVFNINGTERSYRMFPVVKAFGKDGQEITDPTAPEFRELMIDQNSKVVHILHCFVEKDYIKAALNSKPDQTFKEYAQTASKLLPKDFQKKELDIFLQYQWQIQEGRDRTYLELPKKMKYGSWLCPHKPGNWKEERKENPSDGDSKALKYVNERGEEHPFTKNGWFMSHDFAKQQGATGAPATAPSTAAAAMNAAPQAEAPTNGTATTEATTTPPAVW